MACSFLQIPNDLTIGPAGMKEIEDSDVGGPLPITHVIWHYDTHLQQRKRQDFTSVFAFVDHVPGMACKIAAMEPHTRTCARPRA